jgi:hypothetical protein
MIVGGLVVVGVIGTVGWVRHHLLLRKVSARLDKLEKK